MELIYGRRFRTGKTKRALNLVKERLETENRTSSDVLVLCSTLPGEYTRYRKAFPGAVIKPLEVDVVEDLVRRTPIYGDTLDATDLTNQETCGVCLEANHVNSSLILECGHVLHCACYEQARREATCPLCRAPLTVSKTSRKIIQIPAFVIVDGYDRGMGRRLEHSLYKLFALAGHLGVKFAVLVLNEEVLKGAISPQLHRLFAVQTERYEREPPPSAGKMLAELLAAIARDRTAAVSERNAC